MLADMGSSMLDPYEERMCQDAMGRSNGEDPTCKGGMWGTHSE